MVDLRNTTHLFRRGMADAGQTRSCPKIHQNWTLSALNLPAGGYNYLSVADMGVKSR
jgi:hypothetical protein